MGVYCCDICKLGYDNCQDGDGNPINLDSPLAACNYDSGVEYYEALKRVKCRNCGGTGKIKEYSRTYNFKQATEVKCNWCCGTGIQRKFL